MKLKTNLFFFKRTMATTHSHSSSPVHQSLEVERIPVAEFSLMKKRYVLIS